MIAHVLIGIGLLILVDSAAITSFLWIMNKKDTEFSTKSSMLWNFLEVLSVVTALAVSVTILISIVTVAVGLIAVHFPDVLK